MQARPLPRDAAPSRRTRAVAGLLAGLLAAVAAAMGSPASAAAPAAAAPQARSEPAPRRLLTGWLPYWTTSTSLAAYLGNADLFADISPFWHRARWDPAAGRIYVGDYLPPAERAALVARLRTAGRPVLPTVVDATGWRRMATLMVDPGRRSAHVRQLVDLVLAAGYDGIDLDYEGFAFADGVSTWAATREGWVAFVRELAAALHSHDRLLAVTIPPPCDVALACGGRHGYWVYGAERIGAIVDRLRIMTYDYSWDRPGPISPAWWARGVAAYTIRHMPSRRLQLGAPTYARNWVRPDTADADGDGDTREFLLTGSCPSPAAAGPREQQAYASIVRRAEHSAAAIPDLRSRRGYPTVHWDSRAKEKWFRYPLTSTWTDDDGTARSCTAHREVWFSDADAIAARARLVGELNLGGLALWTVGGEDEAQWARVRRYAVSIGPPVPKVAIWAPPVLVYGRASTVVARAELAGRPLPGARAILLRRSGDGPWVEVRSVTLDADGRTRFRIRPTTSTRWRVVLPAAEGHVAAQSRRTPSTLVRPAVRASLPRPVVRPGVRFPVHARVSPAVPGQLVRIQLKRVGAGWRTTAEARADDRGRIRVTLPSARTPGRWWYRVVPAATAARLPGYSPPLLLRTR